MRRFLVILHSLLLKHFFKLNFNNPSYKDDNARFTTTPLKGCVSVILNDVVKKMTMLDSQRYPLKGL